MIDAVVQAKVVETFIEMASMKFCPNIMPFEKVCFVRSDVEGSSQPYGNAVQWCKGNH